MKKTLIVGLVFVFAGVALADWDEGDPALFALLPDLSTNGMDVLAGPSYGYENVWIADDFTVSHTTRLTDLHIWGSWLGDIYPHLGASNVEFSLSIYDDIPAYTGGKPYSRPGNLLWQTPTGGEGGIAANSVRMYEDDLQEGWYVPHYPRSNSLYLPEGDTVCWQYNFYFDPDAAFELESGKVYWLEVFAMPGELAPGEEGHADFGWKTSYQHYNDTAVLKDWTSLPNIPEWQELKYPSGHSLQGQGIDLAFVITPEPATLGLLVLGGLVLVRRRS